MTSSMSATFSPYRAARSRSISICSCGMRPARSTNARPTPRIGSMSLQHFVDLAFQHTRIVAKELDDDLTVDLRNRLQDIVADGLREGRLDAGHVIEHLLHPRDQLAPW